MKIEVCNILCNLKVANCFQNPRDIFEDITVLGFDDILYIENYNRNTLIVSEFGEFLITPPFSRMKTIFMEHPDFSNCHYSYFVNTEKIIRYSQNFLYFKANGKEYQVPVSRRKKRELKRKSGE